MTASSTDDRPGAGTDASVSVDGRRATVERDGRVFAFDAAGRLLTAYVDGRIYRRGLDGTLVEKHWTTVEPPAGRAVDGVESATTDRGPLRTRASRYVGDPERSRLVATAYEVAHEVAREYRDEHALAPPARTTLDRLLECGPEGLAATSARANEIYGPVGVLPPDQYRALVFQLRTGCPHRCSFCTLYRDAPVVVRDADAFAEHVSAVTSFLGRGVRTRRSVFLGDADPLAAPHDAVVAALEIVADRVPTVAAGGVTAFATVRTLARTPPDRVAALAARGLDRVYLGVESGSAAVLDVLRKPQTPPEVETAIERAKAAGIDVGAIVMAGVGGATLAADHVDRTVDLLGRSPLTDADVVYVSPFAAADAADYEQRARARGIEPLDEYAILAQAAELRERLATTVPAPVSQYFVSSFVHA